VEAVLGLVEDAAPQPVYDLRRDLLAPVRRQAMEKTSSSFMRSSFTRKVTNFSLTEVSGIG